MKRATSKWLYLRLGRTDFNPRPREEGDGKLTNFRIKQLISIHALVKRATQPLQTRLSNHDISIHALVKRATFRASGEPQIQAISIHALVKRATHSVNSTITSQCISIHALVKRATFMPWREYFIQLISIHALVKRATSTAPGIVITLPFQSTPS